MALKPGTSARAYASALSATLGHTALPGCTQTAGCLLYDVSVNGSGSSQYFAIIGLIAIRAGVALHHYVGPVMAHAAQTDMPASALTVYHPLELVLLALSGLAIAVAGALLPASWAAHARTASALRAE